MALPSALDLKVKVNTGTENSLVSIHGTGDYHHHVPKSVSISDDFSQFNEKGLVCSQSGGLDVRTNHAQQQQFNILPNYRRWPFYRLSLLSLHSDFPLCTISPYTSEVHPSFRVNSYLFLKTLVAGPLSLYVWSFGTSQIKLKFPISTGWLEHTFKI